VKIIHENVFFPNFSSINGKTMDIAFNKKYFKKYLLPIVSGVCDYIFADV